MKKRSLAWCLGLAALAAAPAASSQTLTLGEDTGRDPYETPQNFSLELRFSPWQPDVDSEFGGRAHPFRDYFGGTDENGQLRVTDHLLGGLQFDWQALRVASIFSLGLGVSASYSNFAANAPITASGQRSGQESTLHVVPMAALAVLRFDLLARRTVVPLVFYGKAGVAVTHWWIDAGDDYARRNAASPAAPDNTADFGRSARGFSYGWQVAAGAMLRLDFLEPRVQRSWDMEMGVNHSYVFAEYTMVSDWQRPQLHLGSKHWTFGVAFEF